MGFDRNPHVAKAVAAEQKARDAGDVSARTLAWREAARLWERAAEREMSDKRKAEYTRNAETARETADAPDGVAVEPETEDVSAAKTRASGDTHGMN